MAGQQVLAFRWWCHGWGLPKRYFSWIWKYSRWYWCCICNPCPGASWEGKGLFLQRWVNWRLSHTSIYTKSSKILPIFTLFVTGCFIICATGDQYYQYEFKHQPSHEECAQMTKSSPSVAFTRYTNMYCDLDSLFSMLFQGRKSLCISTLNSVYLTGTCLVRTPNNAGIICYSKCLKTLYHALHTKYTKLRDCDVLILTIT